MASAVEELDRRGGAQATGLLQAMEFVGEAPAVRTHVSATNSTAELERERLGQERCEAERLVAEQERQRKDQERIEAERLADLEQLSVEHVSGACGGGTVGSVGAARRAGARACRGRNRSAEGTTSGCGMTRSGPPSGGPRTQETPKAIGDEARGVEAARMTRGCGVRLAEEDSTLAAKVKALILDQAADSVDQREAARFPAPFARGIRKSKKGFRGRIVESGGPVRRLSVGRWETRCPLGVAFVRHLRSLCAIDETWPPRTSSRIRQRRRHFQRSTDQITLCWTSSLEERRLWQHWSPQKVVDEWSSGADGHGWHAG